MENETVLQAETTEERTFTQAELDAIVSDRLKRDRQKYADYDALKEKAAKYDEAQEAEKTELERATARANSLQGELDTLKHLYEVRELRDKVSTETGVPATLLSADTEDEMRAQAKAILDFRSPGYPSVFDAGEVTHTVGKKTTKQQFAEWAESAFSS